MFEILENDLWDCGERTCVEVQSSETCSRGLAAPWTPALGGARRWIPLGPLDVFYFMDLLIFLFKAS